MDNKDFLPTSKATCEEGHNSNRGDNKETYLTQENIKGLCHIFKDRDEYIEHMETLIGLREMFLSQCGDSCDPNTSSPLFRVVRLADELIGALLQDNVHFAFENGFVTHTINE